MSSLRGIIGAASKDGTKSKRHVGAIDVLVCDNVATAIERCRRKDAVFKQLSETGVTGK